MALFRYSLTADWRAQVASMLPVNTPQLDALERLINADRLIDDECAQTSELAAWVTNVMRPRQPCRK